jgi:HEAT repeat protein
MAAIETAGLLCAEDAVPDLGRVLEGEPAKKVRRATVLALARIATPATRPAMKALLNDKDDDVRASAAEGLGRLAQSEDLPALESLWASETRASARLSLAFALTRAGHGATGDLSPLGYLVNSLNQKAWRGVALPYLSELALNAEARRAILSAAEHASTSEEKMGLAQALSECHSADAVPLLERLAKDEDPAVEREALRALRILKGTLQ